MQPEMLRSMGPRSYRKSRSSKRRWIASATGIDLAFARAQKSPPGQQMTSFRVFRLAVPKPRGTRRCQRSEEHTSELQSRPHLVCRLLLAKKKTLDITVPVDTT